MAFKTILRKIIKRTFGIDGIGLFLKKKKKSVMRNLYRKQYSAKDIVKVMKDMGMKEGSTVFVHSSMTEFYNFTGSCEELIYEILDVIGSKGTLMMPAYPPNKNMQMNGGLSSEIIAFDYFNSPSGAGYLSEIFRRYPGVKRSINLQHSVCAVGRLADYFLYEHHLSNTAWDEKSPYYKMSQEEGTLVFAFGLPYFLGTMIHCTESILKDKYLYFSNFFTRNYSYSYKGADGSIGVCNGLTHNFERKRSKKKIIKRYFQKSQFNVAKLSNLRIEMVDAKYTLELMLALAERGITMYTKPSPMQFIRNGKFILKDEIKNN